MAAGRCRSHATRSGARPSVRRCRASLAQNVVLPDPCSPAIRMIVGGFERHRQPRRGAAHQGRELLVDDLDDLLVRRQRRHDLAARRPRLDRIGQLLDDRQADVRLEQRQPDRPHRLVDVRRRSACPGHEDRRRRPAACRRGSRTSATGSVQARPRGPLRPASRPVYRRPVGQLHAFADYVGDFGVGGLLLGVGRRGSSARQVRGAHGSPRLPRPSTTAASATRSCITDEDAHG